MSLARLSLLNGRRFISTSQASSYLFRLTRRIRLDNLQTEPHTCRDAFCENTGAIKPIPKWYPYGTLKVLLVVTAYVAFGALISKTVAEFLEDNEIFIPEEEDD